MKRPRATNTCDYECDWFKRDDQLDFDVASPRQFYCPLHRQNDDRSSCSYQNARSNEADTKITFNRT